MRAQCLGRWESPLHPPVHTVSAKTGTGCHKTQNPQKCAIGRHFTNLRQTENNGEQRRTTENNGEQRKQRRYGELGTGNGERGTGNGERGTGNGERGTGNGERRTENEERRTENGERRTGNGERRTENGERRTERTGTENDGENGMNGTTDGERYMAANAGYREGRFTPPSAIAPPCRHCGMPRGSGIWLLHDQPIYDFL